MGALEEAHLGGGLDPAEPLVGPGGPEVVALLHVGPPPVHHLRGDSGQEVLAPGPQYEALFPQRRGAITGAGSSGVGPGAGVEIGQGTWMLSRMGRPVW